MNNDDNHLVMLSKLGGSVKESNSDNKAGWLKTSLSPANINQFYIQKTLKLAITY